MIFFEPGRLVRWAAAARAKWQGNPGEAVGFSLKANDEVYAFYRQLCCVNHDAEMYFHMLSSPLWLSTIYGFWGWVPRVGARVRAWLVACLLWIQYRVIYSKNDYFEDEGMIPYTWYWRQIPAPVLPPKKWVDKELQSRVSISRLVLKICYWVGTKILGMEAKYEEYEGIITAIVSVDKKLN